MTPSASPPLPGAGTTHEVGNSFSAQTKECDVASLFSDRGAYFFDNTQDQYDPVQKRPSPILVGSVTGGHSHLYGSPDSTGVSAYLYIPKGGKIVSPNTRIPGSPYLGSSRDTFAGIPTHNANYVLIQFAKLGKLTNVTLAIFHIDNFQRIKQPDGRERIGTIGFSSADNYGSGGAMPGNGGHSHFELLKGLKWNLQNRTQLKFGDICGK